MNRIDFMNRLAALLSDIPEEERKEAIEYYNDYLDDAGVENEEEVLEALGTPEEVATSIREGLEEYAAEGGEFSERGFKEKVQERNELNLRYRSSENARKKKGMSGGAIALIIICSLLAAPVLLPLAFSVLVVVAALVAVAVVVALVFLFAGVICIVAGIIALVKAVMDLFVVPAVAMLEIGISLLTVGIGILLTMGIGWLVMKVFPKAFRAIVNFFARLVHRKGGSEA